MLWSSFLRAREKRGPYDGRNGAMLPGNATAHAKLALVKAIHSLILMKCFSHICQVLNIALSNFAVTLRYGIVCPFVDGRCASRISSKCVSIERAGQ